MEIDEGGETALVVGTTGTTELDESEVRSPDRKIMKKGGHEEDQLTALMAMVAKGFRSSDDKLERIQSRLDTYDARFTSVEARISQLETQMQGRSSAPSAGSAESSRPGSEVLGVLGGFRRDTRKACIEEFLRTRIPELHQKGGFAPGPRTSVALVPFGSMQELRHWMPKVSKFSVEGRPLWLAPSRTPQERAQRRELGGLLRIVRPKAAELQLEADVNHRSGIIWMGDHRIAERKKDGGWDLHEQIIKDMVPHAEQFIGQLKDQL